MEWVERPWTAVSPDQIDERWRAALRQHGTELPPGKTCLCVPPWKRDRRHKSEERSWLLFDREEMKAIDSDCLIWTPCPENQGEKLEMHYPKRAPAFVRGSVDRALHES
jgi:hypothetical protein